MTIAVSAIGRGRGYIHYRAKFAPKDVLVLHSPPLLRPLAFEWAVRLSENPSSPTISPTMTIQKCLSALPRSGDWVAHDDEDYDEVKSDANGRGELYQPKEEMADCPWIRWHFTGDAGTSGELDLLLNYENLPELMYHKAGTLAAGGSGPQNGSDTQVVVEVPRAGGTVLKDLNAFFASKYPMAFSSTKSKAGTTGIDANNSPAAVIDEETGEFKVVVPAGTQAHDPVDTYQISADAPYYAGSGTSGRHTRNFEIDMT